MNEFEDLSRLEKLSLPYVHFETLESVTHKGVSYPIKSVVIGSKDKTLPTIGFFGGVHGLERIGSQVIIAFLTTLFQQLSWNKQLQADIQNFRIVAIPIVNPGGMARFSRSNPNDVDLMRNSPVEAEGETTPLISGHRVGPYLPWYRGKAGVIEKEAAVLMKFVQDEMFSGSVSLALDVHSGFGVRDQLWYPYAKKKGGFPKEREALLLKDLLDKTYPNHIYKFEAQSLNYITHGDLWDYLFDEYQKEQRSGLFLPLTLELGSWNWIRKNPLQFFSKMGLFHPIKLHRHARIMRRHLLLFDFLQKAVRNHEVWK